MNIVIQSGLKRFLAVELNNSQNILKILEATQFSPNLSTLSLQYEGLTSGVTVGSTTKDAGQLCQAIKLHNSYRLFLAGASALFRGQFSELLHCARHFVEELQDSFFCSGSQERSMAWIDNAQEFKKLRKRWWGNGGKKEWEERFPKLRGVYDRGSTVGSHPNLASHIYRLRFDAEGEEIRFSYSDIPACEREAKELVTFYYLFHTGIHLHATTWWLNCGVEWKSAPTDLASYYNEIQSQHGKEFREWYKKVQAKGESK